MNHTVMSRIIQAAGSQSELARKLGIRCQSVQQWVRRSRVPAERVLEVEDITGVPRYLIRPDLYPRSER
jgi:DNA-binding transcriptional regulator YdaS (Cro superfamily)